MINLSALRRSLPFWASNSQVAWKKYQMYNWSLSDPLVRAYCFNKFYQLWYAYPFFYNHWFMCFFSMGCAAAVLARNGYFNSEFALRRGEGRRFALDRMEIYYYALPYYNHHLRNFSAVFRNSLIDNEPDYMAHHPWGIRPDRTLSFKRVGLWLSLPWYFTDVPHYEDALHVNRQKKFEEEGYCPPLNPTVYQPLDASQD